MRHLGAVKAAEEENTESRTTDYKRIPKYQYNEDTNREEHEAIRSSKGCGGRK